MPYPAPHNVLVMTGTVASGTSVDIWQTGVRIGGNGGNAVSSNPATTAIMDDVAADLLAWWTSVRGSFANNVKFERFKFNAVDVEGRYVSQTLTLQRDMPAASQAGTGAGAPLPAQLAIAATMLTDASRGLASKGRMYLPSPSSSAMTAQGARVAATHRDTLQSATATLLTNLGNWPGLDAAGSPGRPILASKVREGASRPITGVSVGDRFDVQRRRANKITEVRVPSSPVT